MRVSGRALPRVCVSAGDGRPKRKSYRLGMWSFTSQAGEQVHGLRGTHVRWIHLDHTVANR